MSVKQKILELIPESRSNYEQVIFLENSNGLADQGGASTLREFLIENKIRHNVIYNLSDLNNEQLRKVAKSCLDTLVVFETTGMSETFKRLIEIFIELTNSGYRFRFMECSVYNFQMYRLPEEVGEGCISYHNLLCSSFGGNDEWSLNEVKK